jgi:hypothetical protein
MNPAAAWVIHIHFNINGLNHPSEILKLQPSVSLKPQLPAGLSGPESGIIQNMKGLELSRRFFLETAMPVLREEFGSRLDRIAAGLVGPGSECWGFDDEISRDHDWGAGFCLWLDHELFKEVGEQLARAYELLPKEFMGFQPRKALPGEQGRVGVIIMEDFFRRYTSLTQPPKSLEQWARIPTGNLSLVTNGKVFHDPLGRFTAWRRVLADEFPEDLRLRQIAANCMNAGQAGQYNLSRSYRRKDQFAWRFALDQFCKEVLELAHWLNRRYPPYYKWLHKSVKGLPILGARCHQAVSEIYSHADFEPVLDLVERLSQDVIGRLKEQDLTQSPSDFLLDHGPEVQGRIKDPGLRRRFQALA